MRVVFKRVLKVNQDRGTFFQPTKETVHFWQCGFDADKARVRHYRSLLAQDEIIRAEKFKFEIDSSKAGILWTLCTSGTLVISEKRFEQDVEQLVNVVETNRVSHTLMLPSLYNMDTMASPWTLGTPERLKARSRSFFIRFFKSPLKSIKTFFEDRFWWISPTWVRLFGNENQKELEKVKINLRKICRAYDWKKHPGKISLILTEKPHESLQKVTIDSWKELAGGGVEMYYAKGDHRTLFEEPDVRFVSNKIDEAIIE